MLFRVALWLIPVGFLCAAATPLHRVACLHITFVAGLMALTFATSVHVTLLHSGHEAEAERSSPAVATTVLLLYLAAALRVGADWLRHALPRRSDCGGGGSRCSGSCSGRCSCSSLRRP